MFILLALAIIGNMTATYQEGDRVLPYFGSICSAQALSGGNVPWFGYGNVQFSDDTNVYFHDDIGQEFTAPRSCICKIKMFYEIINIEEALSGNDCVVGLRMLTYKDVRSIIPSLIIRARASNNIYYLLALGCKLLECNRFKESRCVFQKVIRIDPQCATAYYGIGKAYSGENDYKLACDNYRKCFEISPYSVIAITECAQVHFRLNDTRKALLLLEDLHCKYPSNGNIHYNYAYMLQLAGHYQFAINEYNKITEDAIGSSEPIKINTIACLIYEQHYGLAIEKSETLLQDCNSSAKKDVLLLIITAYLLNGEKEKALLTALQTVCFFSCNSDTISILADIMYEFKHANAAYLLYRLSLAIDHHNVNTQIKLIWFCLTSNSPRINLEVLENMALIIMRNESNLYDSDCCAIIAMCKSIKGDINSACSNIIKALYYSIMFNKNGMRELRCNIYICILLHICKGQRYHGTMYSAK